MHLGTKPKHNMSEIYFHMKEKPLGLKWSIPRTLGMNSHFKGWDLHEIYNVHKGNLGIKSHSKQMIFISLQKPWQEM